MIYVGTSGYSFPDWVGPFYPPGLASREMLSFYGKHFRAVEINSTYYRIPPPLAMEHMAERTPPGFRFTVKLHGDHTHRRTRDPAVLESFLAALEPLERAGRFAGVLAQFPYSFRPSEEHRDYLRYLRESLGARPLFVEFRHDLWAKRETFALLDELSVGFCAVDEPKLPGLFPAIVRPTGPVGYIRFHGRNARDWWGGDGSQRYNYLYTDEELREWRGAIRSLEARSRDTFVFFNNCHAGAAVQNAMRMAELLELPLGPPAE